MLFTVRAGSDPVAKADATLLRALGLPAGGAAKVGNTHVLIRGGDVPEPTAILLGPISMDNAGVRQGQSIDVSRAVLSQAQLVVVAEPELPGEPKDLVRALQGRPASSGDRIEFDGAYLDTDGPVAITVNRVEPNGAGLIGPATRFTTAGSPQAVEALPQAHPGVKPAVPLPPAGP
ncbi:MAG: hypothetical protein OEX04_20480, partial [Acidimicrobiia bacterium]|nr:hypothetical protein [Acidimicrobiia bacterium]